MKYKYVASGWNVALKAETATAAAREIQTVVGKCEMSKLKSCG